MLRRRLLMMMQQAQAVWRTVTRTGTGLIVADDTTEGMPVTIEMQGWTKQDSPTGAQLFDAKSVVRDTVIEQYGTLSSAVGYFTSDFIKINPSTTYHITATGSKRGKYFDENKQPITTNTYSDFVPENGTSFTTFKNAAYIRFSGLTSQVESVMLNVGSVSKPYDPYTGGQPAPSPDYPQEIRNSGKYNEGTQRYEYKCIVTTKNLLDIQDITQETPQTAIECNITQDIFISAQESPTVSKAIWRFQAVYKDGTLRFLNDQNEINWTFPATKENPIVKIIFRGIFITSGSYKNVQVEYGTSATSYVPHVEQTVIITSDRIVSKWDRMECRDGMYGWVHKTMIGKLNGDEEWNMYNDTGTQVFITTLDPFVMQDDGYMDSFLLADNRPVENNHCFARSFYYGEYTIAIRHDETSTLEEFKRFLKENNVQYVFEGIEEKFVPLQEEEQAALKALKTYFPTTVFVNDQNLFMQVEYNTKVSEKESE